MDDLANSDPFRLHEVVQLLLQTRSVKRVQARQLVAKFFQQARGLRRLADKLLEGCIIVSLLVIRHEEVSIVENIARHFNAVAGRLGDLL